MKLNEVKSWVHCGIGDISEEKFERIDDPSKRKRHVVGKPDGGLWASPVNSKLGWETWCKLNEFFDDIYCDGNNKHFFKLKDTAKIAEIDSLLDLQVLLKKYKKKSGYSLDPYELDYIKMQEDGYDGVYLTERGVQETVYECLRNWDVESIVLFNLDCIE